MNIKHFYFGYHNTWYDEIVHECNCGFESHEKYQVDAHVNAEKCAEEIERMREEHYDARSNTR